MLTQHKVDARRGQVSRQVKHRIKRLHSKEIPVRAVTGRRRSPNKLTAERLIVPRNGGGWQSLAASGSGALRQLSDIGWNIVDNPVLEPTQGWRVRIVAGNHVAFCSRNRLPADRR